MTNQGDLGFDGMYWGGIGNVAVAEDVFYANYNY